MDKIGLIKREYEDYINSHAEEMRDAAKDLKADLERSPLFFRGRFTSRPLAIPKIYSEEMIRDFEGIVGTAYRIFEKVIDEYLRCSDYRTLFPFSRKLTELIMAPAGYGCLLPLSRFDIFYNEETRDFYFCEINCDGATGMNEDRLQDKLMIHNPAHQEIIRKHSLRSFELFDSLVDAFLKAYSTYEKRVERPNVAIVDFLDSGTCREFEEFARRFQKAGVFSEVCDIRELRYEGGKLLSKSGHFVDAVYRRAVTSDVMENYESVQPFVNAVKDAAVFLFGAFRTQVVHSKWLFYILFHPRTAEFLTDKELEFIKKHVPYTVPFDRKSIDPETVRRNKDAYILKPVEGYGSKDVFAGITFSEEEWERKTEEVLGAGYLCQAYVPQYESPNADFVFGDGIWENYISMPGLYVYNGKFAGVFARAGRKGGIIDHTYNEYCQPVYVLGE